MSKSASEERDDQEATLFAMDLLMPRRLIESELAKTAFKDGLDVVDDHRIVVLARKFQVPVQMMTVQLARLGYFGVVGKQTQS